MPHDARTRYHVGMLPLPLLLAFTAHAVVVRAPVVIARPAAAVAPLTLSLLPSLSAAADSPAPLTPSVMPGFAPDKEATLIAKLAAKLPSQDSVSRAKTAAWIRDIAVENPRAVVQAAALDALAADAEAATNLSHFESLAASIEAFAATTPYDSVFEDAVFHLVDAARRAGRAQRASALAVAERIGRSGSPERREKAATLIEGLKGQPGFHLEDDELSRAAARVRAGR